jgi:tetratricopeptide (TPR) repeat protein
MTMLLLFASLFVTPAHAGGITDALKSSYAYEAQGKYAEALAAITGQAATGDSLYLVAVRRGWLNYLAGQHADAVLAYKEALALHPRAVEALVGQAAPLIALKRWPEAQTACTQALEIAPGNYLAASRLAWVLYSQGKYAEAAIRYQSVVEQFPADLEMRAGLAWAWLRSGKVSEARQTFAWILEVSPTNASAKDGLTAAGAK